MMMLYAPLVTNYKYSDDRVSRWSNRKDHPAFHVPDVGVDDD